MVKTRVDNQPIAFTGQVVAYGAGIENLYNPYTFTDTDQRVITVANPNPTTDNFYYNLGTGQLPRRDKINVTDNLVEVNESANVYSPKV